MSEGIFEKLKKEFFGSPGELVDRSLREKAKIKDEKTAEDNDLQKENLDDEEAALEELKRIKKEDPPFWVQRGKDFSSELDVSKIPPGTARDILKRYKELAQKREPEKKEGRAVPDTE